jgi:hypothetical protein
MNSKVILLLIAASLILFGLLKPNLLNINPVKPSVVVVEPLDTDLKKACEDVTEIFKKAGSSSFNDANRLASLYSDLAHLISLDEENEVIKNTKEIREANNLSGVMLNLNIQNKYPDLASKSNAVIVAGLGDDEVLLDKDLRKKAVNSFMALAWACKKGTE